MENLGGFLGSIGGGIINGIASLFGADSASRINKQNIEMQRETNELNYKMFKENQQWSEDMWNQNNLYNTPGNKKERMVDAGLNPLFYGLDGQNAQQPQLVGTPTAQSPRADNVPGFAIQQGLSQMGNIFADTAVKMATARKLNEDANATEIDNLTRALLNKQSYNLMGTQISLGMSNIRLNNSQAEVLAKQCEQLSASTESIYQSLEQNWEHLRIDWFKAQTEKELGKMHLSNEERKITADILQGWFDLATKRDLAQSVIRLNDKSSEFVMQQALGKEYENQITAGALPELTQGAANSAAKTHGELRITNSDADYRDTEHEVNIWTTCFNAAANCLKSVTGAYNATKW
ncbi:minor capsid protein [Capybara microvirus Cap1_SP_22]|nr:minor capsid protein [Capybara microvirus Cap1_SP_22]